MTRTHSLARMLAAALAITAIAIPAAAAKPVDLRSPDAQNTVSSAPPNARGTEVAAPGQQVPRPWHARTGGRPTRPTLPRRSGRCPDCGRGR